VFIDGEKDTTNPAGRINRTPPIPTSRPWQSAYITCLATKKSGVKRKEERASEVITKIEKKRRERRKVLLSKKKHPDAIRSRDIKNEGLEVGHQNVSK